MSTFNIDDSIYAIVASPLDAKLCNWIYEGYTLTIETIEMYLQRVPRIELGESAFYRSPGVLVTMLLPKEGVGPFTYEGNDFYTNLPNFDIKYYTFIDGVEDDNFKEVPFGIYTYIAYASSLTGTDFSLVSEETLDYIAIITSKEKLEPIVTDFEGSWYQYKFRTSKSISGSGTINDKIQLVSDEEAPGIEKYYGTNIEGVKGYHPIPEYTSGNGMNFTGTEIILGNPSTITGVTGNAVTETSHTHALGAIPIENLPPSVQAASNLMTGWNVNAWYDEVTPSFDENTRTFTLTPISGSYEYYVKGVKYIKSAPDSIQILNTDMLQFIVYTGATLELISVAGWIDAIKNKTKCMVAGIYWNVSQQKAILKAAEPHTYTISGGDHHWKHHTIGTRYGGGLGLAVANSWQLNVAEGSIFDEDIEIFIKDNTTSIFGQNLSVLESKKLYRLGLGLWYQDFAIPSNIVSLSPVNRVYHNINTGGTWTLAETTVNKYSAMWIIATDDFDNPVICVLGQGSSTTLPLAKEGNDYADMDFSGLPAAEFRLLGRVIVKSITSSPYYEISDIVQMQADDIIPGGDITKDSYVTAANFEPTNKILTLTRNNGLTPVTAEIQYPDITSGAGMDFTENTIILGTPSNITDTSINSVTEHSHTHKLEDITVLKVNDGTNSTEVVLGNLYNQFAITDPRNIANLGWEVSSVEDWLTLESVEGGALKDTDLLYWNTPNFGATNALKFNVRGAGSRQADGSYSGIKAVALFWVPESINNFGTTRSMYAFDDGIFGGQQIDRRTGCSVRLVKTSTTLNNGETGTYIGNDGNTYPTICINGKEWLAANLMESLYRNKDTIVAIADNILWEGATTGARTAYNNDWANSGTIGATTIEIKLGDTITLPLATPVTIDPDSNIRASITETQILTIKKAIASDVINEPLDNITSTNVQDAINELANKLYWHTAYDYNIVGLKNGSNQLFTIFDQYLSGSPRVYLNGLRLQKGDDWDYIETLPDKITLNYPIRPTDLLLIDYIKLN